MENDSFKAQVSAFFDTDGRIHPRWCRFKNGLVHRLFNKYPIYNH